MDAMHSHPDRQVQRLLWAIGDAHRRRRSGVVIGWAIGRGRSGRHHDRGRRSLVRPGPRSPRRCGAPHLDLFVAARGGHAHLSLVGELDGFTAPEVLGRVRDLVEEGARSVVVDLGGTEVIDSHGLAALVSASTLLDQHKGEMVLKSPRSATLKLLNLAGLGNRFVIC